MVFQTKKKFSQDFFHVTLSFLISWQFSFVYSVAKNTVPIECVSSWIAVLFYAGQPTAISPNLLAEGVCRDLDLGFIYHY